MDSIIGQTDIQLTPEANIHFKSSFNDFKTRFPVKSLLYICFAGSCRSFCISVSVDMQSFNRMLEGKFGY